MNAILKAIRETSSLSPLPRAVTEGTLPALVTQLSGSMRALCAAMLRADTGRPLAVICADETAARTLAEDLRSLLGAEPVILSGRDMVLSDTEVVSRQDEQRRLRALDALLDGAPAVVCTVAGLLQRTLSPEQLRRSAFTMTVGSGSGPEALEPKLLENGYLLLR